MPLTNNAPSLEGFQLKPFQVIADDATPAVVGQNSIPPFAKVVEVTAVTNDANDWVTLPALSSVPNGHQILVIGTAGANFEVRTPASSNEKINAQDCDGTKEYLFTDTEIHTFTKIDNTIGWMGAGKTALGADNTPVVPD